MSRLVASARQSVPVLSPALETAISAANVSFFGKRETAEERQARLKRGEPAPGMVISAGPRVPPSREVIAEARRILPELEKHLNPAPGERLKAEIDHFLDMLNASVSNPQDTDALLMRKSALAIALEGTPALVWSKATLRAAQRRFKFFPSVAELVAMLEEQIAPMRDRVAQVRIVSRQEPPKPPKPRPRPTDAERKAVAEQMAAYQAEKKAQRDNEERIRNYGTYMPPGAEGFTGWQLIAALKTTLNNLDGDLHAVTEQRINEMEWRFKMAEQMCT